MATSHQTPISSREGMPEIPGYEILCEVGRGGMGVVYKARHVRLDRVVALKMMLVAREAHFLELARFRVEAEAIACLAHPNIILIHEVGVHEGSPYFTLEYAAGGNLFQRTRKEPQSPTWAAEVVRILAQALRHAHNRCILHRDLKPANILLMEDGTPKITDFGLAKFSRSPGRVEDISATNCMDPLTAEVHRLAREFAGDAGQGFMSKETAEHLAVQSLCRLQLGRAQRTGGRLPEVSGEATGEPLPECRSVGRRLATVSRWKGGS